MLQNLTPPRPQILTKLFQEFFDSEKAGGMLLVSCAIISLLIANSPFGSGYIEFWHIELAHHSLTHWINDGLMAVFFLLIGLELERELYVGELSNRKNAALPLVAAIGGMVVPVAIYLLFTHGTPASRGAGIPMATDIAFAVGIISLLNRRIPTALKVFLMALAIFDDLGSILMIAIFYSSDVSMPYVGLCAGVFAVMLIMNRMRIHSIWPYLLGGLVMWYALLHSGIHPSIAGVLLAFAIPFGDGSETSPSYRLQHYLHQPVALIILPLFAIANTAFLLEGDWLESLTQPHSLGILAGLIFGKPFGIVALVSLGLWLGICSLPAGVRMSHVTGVGFLAGIGFTMSIFITVLAFEDPTFIMQSKMAIMLASILAGGIGFLLLRMNKPAQEET